jgi:hypothetical protein
MKKVVLCLALFAILATGTVFADHPGGFGIGVQFGYIGNWGGGSFGNAALSLKLPGLPVFWAARLDMFGGYFGLNVSGDVYLIDSGLIPLLGLNWYLGLGIGAGFTFTDNDVLGLGLSARLPIGISWQLFSFIEVFLQVVPTLGVTVVPEFHFPYGGVGGDLGVRLWF